jgi:formylglycine-generating enzyme required for sulfatase activity
MITPFLRSSLPLVVSRRLSLAVAYSALTCSLSLLASPAGAQTPAGMSLIDSAGKTFHMGDSKNELPNESWPDFEKPVRRVIFTKSFYLGQTEVTYAEWKDVWDWALVHGYDAYGAVGQIGAVGANGTSLPDTPDNRQHPVTNLSWNFAATWCNARSEKEGLTPCYTLRSDGSVYRSTAYGAINCNWEANGYRLPTTAEWEYAARGGVDDGRRFPWGDTITHSQANYRSNWDAAHTYTYDQSPTSGYHPLYNGTAPVGSFPATGFGLRDMAGNVDEWCWDWFPATGTTFFMRPDPETDPHGDIDGIYRDWRSGCYGNSALAIRCAFMDAYVPYQPSWSFGFRVARTALTVEVSAPIFTVQASAQSVTAGNNASFTAAASGTPTPTLQWEVSINSGTSWSDVSNSGVYSGATTGTLAITGATTGMNGYQYHCVTTNSAGSATSNAATLTVNSGVVMVTPLTVSTLAGRALTSGYLDGTGTAALFYYPSGVAVDTAGNLYLSDTDNHTIRKVVTATGAVTTLAGLAGSPGSVDGTGSAARFNNPSGIAVDGTGNVYVADTLNHILRKVTSAGVVTTLAGATGSGGSADGAGNAARFQGPQGLAIDSAGNLYVADTNNHTVRKVVAATGAVTTVAGLAGNTGSADGSGSAARFNFPSEVAIDSTGNIYVADTDNDAIRAISSSGLVSTLAGRAGSPGSVDGTGSAARFDSPSAVAVDPAGNVYVADTGNFTIRRVIPSSGAVSKLAGVAGTSGSADGIGSAVRFYAPAGLAVDGASTLYVADTNNHTVRISLLPITPAIQTQPLSQSVAAGNGVQFSVTASGRPTPTYQWNFGGSPINGATSSSYSITSAQSGNAGDYTVTVTNAMGSVTSSRATLTVASVTPAPTEARGGGGGATSLWFLLALAVLCFTRRSFRWGRPDGVMS